MNRDREIAETPRQIAERIDRQFGGNEWPQVRLGLVAAIEAALTAASAGHQAEVEKARREENEAAIRRLLPTAMLDAWNDIVSDTEAFPEDIERRRGKLYFTPYRWANATASFLIAALSRLTVQEAGEG